MSKSRLRRVDPETARRRSLARLAIVQAVFQWVQSGDPAEEIVDQFLLFRSIEEGETAMDPDADRKFFAEAVRGVVAGGDRYKTLIEPHLTRVWTLARIDRLLLALLLGATHELEERRDIPARTVIAEYVKLAHAFFSGPEPGFVNGTLDALARLARADEFKPAEPSGPATAAGDA